MQTHTNCLQDMELPVTSMSLKAILKVMCMASLLAILLVLIPKMTLARNVTLPHNENFDVSNSIDDIAGATQGGISTWVPNVGWRGSGAVKIVPPLNEGYAHIGNINVGNQTRLNIRWLMNFGRTYQGESTYNKLVILNRVDNQRGNRPMSISGGELVNGAIHRYWGVSQGVTNWGRPFIRDVETLDPDEVFTIATGYNTDQWVSFEYEIDLVAGRINLYIHTEDGRFQGIHSTVDMTVTESNPASNPVNLIECIGCYFSQPGSEAPYFNLPWTDTNYFLIDELVISDNYIGPPSGFSDFPPPAAIDDAQGQ